MRNNLMSCLPTRKRIQFFIFRLKHWKEIKKLRAAIDREFIYGTSDEKPKGLIKAAEEREMREKRKSGKNDRT